MSSNRCSLQKYKNDLEKPNTGKNEPMMSPSTWQAEAATSNKGAVHPYSAAVAQRALYVINRRRGCGRRAGNKDAKSGPSRLSKVSVADEIEG